MRLITQTQNLQSVALTIKQSSQVEITQPPALSQLPLLGRVSNTTKDELSLTNQMLKARGLIPKPDQSLLEQDAEAIAVLEWHLQCAAVANTPAG